MAPGSQASHACTAVIECTLDGTVTAANARFLGLLAYRAKDLIGRNRSCLVRLSARDGAAYRKVGHALRRSIDGAREMSSDMQAMTTAVEEISRNVGLIAHSSREPDPSTRPVREAPRKMAR